MPTVEASQSLSPRRPPSLLSSICHDLKAPLASIVMGAGFLRRVLPAEDESARRVAEAIGRAATRMNDFIGVLSDLARLEARDVTLDVRPHAVASLLRQASERIHPEAVAQGIPLGLDAGTDVDALLVSCDAIRLEQALRYLAACAMRVVPEGGTVSLRATHDGTYVRFAVEAERSSSASNRLIQDDIPQPELAIAKGLVELHGGVIEIAGDGETLALSFALNVQGITSTAEAPH
jgi:two-component system sensor histidine kinase KdpD